MCHYDIFVAYFVVVVIQLKSRMLEYFRKGWSSHEAVIKLIISP